jgi:SAM-dependent methyltransferase
MGDRRALRAMKPQELKEQFHLTYHINCLERADKANSLRGRRVLEVGGALPEALVLDHYEAAAWTSVDYRSAYSSALAGFKVGARTTMLKQDSPPAADGQYVSYDGDANSLPPSFDEAFDVVVSLATFEHIGNLVGALERMYASLRPGGVLVSQVGPVWSGFRGHHIFAGHLGKVGADKTDDLLDHIVPWQHLIMRPSDMEAWLKARYGTEYAEAAVEWIYLSPRLNRLFLDDYRTLFADAGFLGVDSIKANGAPVPAGWLETLTPLLAIRYPGRADFEVDSFWVTLEKPDESKAGA